jgi:general stress protein YciG
MAGTPEGGKLAVETNKKRHGEDFYARIGRLGGKVSRGGGFMDREFASEMGRIGGVARWKHPKSEEAA